MKKLLYISLIFILFFVSCKKEYDIQKELETAINKMSYFNETFDKAYADGTITKDDTEDCEYNKLKKIASEYYGIMDKMNNSIKEDIEAGRENKLEEQYKKLLQEKDAEIQETTKKFLDNLAKMKN